MASVATNLRTAWMVMAWAAAASPVLLVAQDAASGEGARSNHWTIPATAASEQNPLPATPQTLERGKALYTAHCAKCHGPQGLNDGPDSIALYANADLTDASRVVINPDGVVFYRIWNGKGGMIPSERMPGFGFNQKLSRDEVWALVAYVQTFRDSARR